MSLKLKKKNIEWERASKFMTSTVYHYKIYIKTQLLQNEFKAIIQYIIYYFYGINYGKV